MKYPEFANEIDAAFKPILAPIGFFRTRYGKWGRNRGEDLHGIDIQKRSSKELVCVNLGIHYTFLPLTCLNRRGIVFRWTCPACKLHFRLNPRGTDGDHWWPIEEGSVEEIAKRFSNGRCRSSRPTDPTE
jgi:hypothetical protein